MEARIDLAAAASLVLAMMLATVGTIWQVEPSRATCEAPCADDATHDGATAEGWEASLHRLAWRVEQGFQQMAGMPRGH